MAIKLAAETPKFAAEWGMINTQSRLAIPAEITHCLSWFDPSRERIEVSIDLCRPKLITIRILDDVVRSLEIERQSILQDSDNADDGLRRVALTHHFFRRATLIVSARRIGLKAAILHHLQTNPGGQLFCLALDNRIEAYNEEAAREIMARYADDVTMQR